MICIIIRQNLKEKRKVNLDLTIKNHQDLATIKNHQDSITNYAIQKSSTKSVHAQEPARDS